MSAQGDVFLPIFISKNSPRDLFENEQTRAKNFEYRTKSGCLKKESARFFHVDINGVKEEALHMKSERGYMTSNLFKYLLSVLDKKCRDQNRQILLLLDNA